MTDMFEVGRHVRFAGTNGVIIETTDRDGDVAYLVENGSARLPMWVPERVLTAHQTSERTTQFRTRLPDILAVDDFFHDPDEVRAIALAQIYGTDSEHYKGLRSRQRILWPGLREEFGRLLGRPVTKWLEHGANGVFQQTTSNDRLVWHHDTQRFAGAVYLTPDPPVGSGTSFWRDRSHGCRRRPNHPIEKRRLGSPEAVRAAESAVYDQHNIQHPDNWELVESVEGLYNRLVIWDASLIHSATSYQEFSEHGPAATRLVQLFFFDA